MLLKEGTRVVNEELSIEVAAVVNVLAQARLVGSSRIALPVVCLCRLIPCLVAVVHDTVAGERLQGKSLHPWHLPDQVEVTTYRTDLLLIVTAITADVNEWVIGSTAVNLSVLVQAPKGACSECATILCNIHDQKQLQVPLYPRCKHLHPSVPSNQSA